MKAVCLKVPKSLGEKVISLAHKLELVNKALLIQRQNDQLWIPLIRQPTNEELSQLKDAASILEVGSENFAEKRPVEETLIQVLEKQLSPELHPSIPRSLDIIGDIAIIEIPNQLETYEGVIGQAILKTHKNIKSVHAKAGAISGVYRIRDLTHSRRKRSTIYNEYGCQYHVDVPKPTFLSIIQSTSGSRAC
jgi:tRNA (guanine37-N1)-methyltransferase